MLARLAAALRAEADRANERRLLVVHGPRDDCYDAVGDADLLTDDAALVGQRAFLPCERVSPRNADRLLGETRGTVVVDCHDACRPNALGRVVGAVDGGGLLVLVVPPLDAWSDRRDGFDEGLAVPPRDVTEVTGHFRARLVATLRAHRGVAVVDAATGEVTADGRTDPAPRLPRERPAPPASAAFPDAAYRTCLTADQAEAVAALEALRGPETAVLVESDRGRGKSAAAGIAAACLAREGLTVRVTAPGRRNADEVFVRAAALLDELGALAGTDGDPVTRVDAEGGGSVAWVPVDAASADPGAGDVLVVDEAAALPVRTLESFLRADRLALATTVHGYEGAGRGFDVRFRDRLADADHDLTTVHLSDPVRYAAGDPVETWAFRALMLDARPAVDPLVADARPADATYRRLTSEELVADEHLLREAFGLLVVAHYRTEPDDLARLLDAPNLAVRALTSDGHVLSVALLAGEGGLDADTRAAMYDGRRVKGNMLPDVLTSQLRDEDAGRLRGRRVVRVATHPAVRSRGLGTRLLDEVRDEYADELDWLGVGFGATPGLVDFWNDAGYDTVHLSTTRNDASGEHSALMLSPTSEAGRALRDRHAEWFAARVPAVLADALRDADPDVVRAALRACPADPDPSLSDRGWRLVAGAAYGPAIYAVDPRPFRRLAVAGLLDPPPGLDDRGARLLVSLLLQARPAEAVADELGFHSRGECLRALGRALRPLVETHGGAVARAERDRFDDG